MKRFTDKHPDGTPYIPGSVLHLSNGMQSVIKRLAEYEDTGLTPKECMNYKIFEDECICDGVQFKDILRLKDMLKGMTCETCRNTGMCSIELDYGVKYCSDWEKKDEV